MNVHRGAAPAVAYNRQTLRRIRTALDAMHAPREMFTRVDDFERALAGLPSDGTTAEMPPMTAVAEHAGAKALSSAL